MHYLLALAQTMCSVPKSLCIALHIALQVPEAGGDGLQGEGGAKGLRDATKMVTAQLCKQRQPFRFQLRFQQGESLCIRCPPL